jgi:hypothetical protein
MNGWMGRGGHVACHETGDEPLLPLQYCFSPSHYNLHQACESACHFWVVRTGIWEGWFGDGAALSIKYEMGYNLHLLLILGRNHSTDRLGSKLNIKYEMGCHLHLL